MSSAPLSESSPSAKRPTVWVIPAKSRGDLNNALALAEQLDPAYSVMDAQILRNMLDAANTEKGSCGPYTISLRGQQGLGEPESGILTPQALPDIILDASGENDIHYLCGLANQQATSPNNTKNPLLIQMQAPDVVLQFVPPSRDQLAFRHVDLHIGFNNQLSRPVSTGLPKDIDFDLEDSMLTPDDTDRIEEEMHGRVAIYDSLPTRLNACVLAAAHASMDASLAPFAHQPPIYMVSVGELSEGDACRLARDIAKAVHQTGGSVLFSDSPRTIETVIPPYLQSSDTIIAHFRAALGDDVPLYTYQIAKNPDFNPYLSMLAIADKVVVTDNSLSMIADAVASGKPTYLFKERDTYGPSRAKYGEIQQARYGVMPVAALAEEAPSHRPAVQITEPIMRDILTAWQRKEKLYTLQANEASPQARVDSSDLVLGNSVAQQVHLR